MKNVLYIGPYRQNDEWGFTSRALVNLLAQQDINLHIKPVWFNQDYEYVNMEEFSEYENKKLHSDQKDVLIQHGIPSYLNYNGNFKENIIVLSLDCEIDNTDWVDHINVFDKVVVFSEYEKELLEKSKVTTPIFNFSTPPVLEDYEVETFPFDIDGTKFYCQASLDKKSGLDEIISAYLSAFSIDDNVMLALCVSPETAQTVEELIVHIKRRLGIYAEASYYAPIAVCPINNQRLMNHVHMQSDYFIDASYNCRISQNILKAINLKSTPIVLDTCYSLFKDDYKYLIKSHDETCLYESRPIKGLYTGSWRVPSIEHLKSLMLQAVKEESREQVEINQNSNQRAKELLCI